MNTARLREQTAALRALLDGAEATKAEEEGLDPGGLPEGAAVAAAPAAQGDDGEPAEPKGEGDDPEDDDDDDDEGDDDDDDDEAEEAGGRPPVPGDDGQLGDESAKLFHGGGYKGEGDDVAVIDAEVLMDMFTAAVTKALDPVTKALGDIVMAHTAGLEATKAVMERADILTREPVASPRRPGVAVTNGLGDHNPASARMGQEATKSTTGGTVQERESLVMPAVFAGSIPLTPAQHYVNKGEWPDGFQPSAEGLEQIQAARSASTTGR